MTRWIAAALAVSLVLAMFVPLVGGIVFVLAVPVAVASSILSRGRPGQGDRRDGADRILAVAASLTGEQGDWGAALRAELATITEPRERRQFAIGSALALLGRPRSGSSFLIAAGVAVASGTGLLAVSRAGLGDDGLGSVTILVPPVLLFAVGYLCARSTASLRFALETGFVAALATLVTVAVVYGVEAAHWYDITPGASVLDGAQVGHDNVRAAVLDAVHPIILSVHLLFWLPWPVAGAIAGRGRRQAAALPVLEDGGEVRG